MIRMNSTPEDALRAHRDLTALPLSLKNARQLGGIRLKDGRRVKRGLLLRTTRLCDASAEDLRRLREDYGLRLILDMRETYEIARGPDPALEGVRWVQTPIIDLAYVRRRLAERLQETQEAPVEPGEADTDSFFDLMLRLTRQSRERGGDDGLGYAYADYLAGPQGQAKLGLFFHELAANRAGAALWHCHTGKDRTGIAAGLILEVLGADWETIVADYETSNLYFEPELAALEQSLRQKGVEEALLPSLCAFAGVHRPMMENAWRYMRETWGGPIDYLIHACGVSPGELDALRERYIEEE